MTDPSPLPPPSASIAPSSPSLPPSSLPPSASLPPSQSLLPRERPKFVFFGVLAAVALLLDVISKSWAEITLTGPRPAIVVAANHLTLTLAYNKGGAWGLLQDESEFVRLPFFLAVSVVAILFIVSLYGKLGPGQSALKWGLPLVLGGALGNLSDRITRSSVIDFIDYRGDWVLAMNRLIAKVAKGWALTDHWPTFNVADIAICVGVGLMAVDMFTARHGRRLSAEPAVARASGPPSAGG